jgi:hypothetical protein
MNSGAMVPVRLASRRDVWITQPSPGPEAEGGVTRGTASQNQAMCSGVSSDLSGCGGAYRPNPDGLWDER